MSIPLSKQYTLISTLFYSLVPIIPDIQVLTPEQLQVPSTFLNMCTLLAVTYVAEITQQFSLWGFLCQVWAFPFLVYFYVVDVQTANPWVVWLVATLLLSYPSCHAVQVGWCSRNSNSVRSRTVSAAMYNMFCQLGGIVASNVYREGENSKRNQHSPPNSVISVT